MARKPSGNSGGNVDPAVIIAGSGEIDGGSGGAGTGVSDAGILIIDPAAVDSGSDGDGNGTDTTGEPRKRRGRKPGSRNAAKASSKLDVSGVESILFSAHAMLASLTKVNELSIEKEEAATLAQAISNVSRHYDVAANQQTLDWANLIMVCGSLYGSRMFAYRLRKSSEKRKPSQSAPEPFQAPSAVIFPIPGANAVQ